MSILFGPQGVPEETGVVAYTPGVFVGSGVPAAFYSAPTPPWQIVHCDMFGLPVSHLTPVASDRSYSCRLNRPAQISFMVPSDDINVRDVNTLSSTIRAYRREEAPDGTFRYVLRFNGYVWSIEDEGGEDKAYTKIVAYDPMQRLSKRLVRSTSGSTTATVKFTNVDAGQIMRELLIRTTAYGGLTGLLAGSFDVCPLQSTSWQRKSVADAYNDLTNVTNGPDLAIVPRESTDGYISQLNVFTKRGSDNTGTLFGWRNGPNNVKNIKRLENAQTIANVLLGIGSMSSGGEVNTLKADTASVLQLGQYEDVIQYSDVKTFSFLDDLVTGDLNVRRFPQVVYGLTPTTDPSSLVPQPWSDYDLGDTIYVMADEALRGGFDKRPLRVFGWDIDIGDEVEVVSQLITAEDSE